MKIMNMHSLVCDWIGMFHKKCWPKYQWCIHRGWNTDMDIHFVSENIVYKYNLIYLVKFVTEKLTQLVAQNATVIIMHLSKFRLCYFVITKSLPLSIENRCIWKEILFITQVINTNIRNKIYYHYTLKYVKQFFETSNILKTCAKSEVLDRCVFITTVMDSQSNTILLRITVTSVVLLCDWSQSVCYIVAEDQRNNVNKERHDFLW